MAVRKTGKRRTAKRKTDSKTTKIAKGDYRVTLLETLELQKLMHQANSLAQDFMLKQNQMQEAQLKAIKGRQEFENKLAEVREEHGLEAWHDIALDDENGGLVRVNARSQAEADKAVDEAGKDEPQEAAQE